VTPRDAFGSALHAIEAVVAAESADPAIDPRCSSFVLHHGRPTERALVLLHGFTNCPRQFAELAQQFFARDFNVYVPRLPRHGLLDKMTLDLGGLTVDELTTGAADSAELAAPLGTRLSVLGLSLGALLAAWLGQTRPIDRAAAIAPFFSVARMPLPIEPALAGGLALAPNLELWWDPRVKDRVGPAHAYPRYATHALAACLKLGERIRAIARDRPALAAQSILILNAKDPAIDNRAARDVWSLLQQRGSRTSEFTFENLDVRHDIIESTTYADAGRLVYPVLLDLLTA
jgi:esterase/lipase